MAAFYIVALVLCGLAFLFDLAVVFSGLDDEAGAIALVNLPVLGFAIVGLALGLA